MKKFMSLVAALMLCVGAQAQIVSSSSRSLKVENAPSTSLKYVRLGVGFMNLAGSDVEDCNSKVGYDVAYGFQKPLANVNGLYWGMEFGLGSRGWSVDLGKDDAKYMLHNVRISPFTFGYKYALTDAIKLDAHLGAFASFDYTGKLKYDGESLSLNDWDDEDDGIGLDWNRFDAGMQIGFGVWYNNFNLDFTYHRGFVKPIEDVKAYSSNFMIRLGVAF